jgi:hypothetical protein
MHHRHQFFGVAYSHSICGTRGLYGNSLFFVNAFFHSKKNIEPQAFVCVGTHKHTECVVVEEKCRARAVFLVFGFYNS